MHTLKNLRSVIDLPDEPNAPVRIIHRSFHDFLVDPRKLADDFSLDHARTHERMTESCFRLLATLMKNICELGSFGKLQKDVHEEMKEQRLSQQVRMLADTSSTTGWNTQRQSMTTTSPCTTFSITSHHLLCWIEAMSLLGELPDCLTMLAELHSRSQGGSQVGKLLHDAHRFLRCFFAGLEAAPLQVYGSALVFAPQNSTVRDVYLGQFVGLHPFS